VSGGAGGRKHSLAVFGNDGDRIREGVPRAGKHLRWVFKAAQSPDAL
jgi:hypothetical protein